MLAPVILQNSVSVTWVTKKLYWDLGVDVSLDLDLLGMIPYASISVDGAGRIVTVNHQAAQLFCYAEDEFLGRPIDSLLPE
jgi:PAS domain-containing protein